MVCIGSDAVAESKSSSSTSVAACEKKEKFTPSGWVVTPNGCAEPGAVSNVSMSCPSEGENPASASSGVPFGDGLDLPRQGLSDNGDEIAQCPYLAGLSQT